MKDDYFSESMGGNIPRVKKNGGGVPISTLIISVIATIFLVLLIVAKWDDILGFFGIQEGESSVESVSDFSVGDELILTGIIKSDGDLTNYTHTLSNDDYGIIGLKSSKLNLNNYTDDVIVQGLVEKIYKGVPIIVVSSIYNLQFDDELTGDQEILENQEKFLPNVGLFLDQKFFDKYALVNDGNGGILKVKDLDSNVIIPISYFKCNPNSMNENCSQLSQNIGGSSNEKFADNYGVVYYKQSNVESWFFTNGLYGYFINDIQSSYVKNLSKNITIINDKYVEKNVLLHVQSICSLENTSLKNIKSKNLSLNSSKIQYSLEGDDGNGHNISCKLEIDPTETNFAKLIDIDVENLDTNLDDSVNNTADGTVSDTAKTTTTWNPNVAQFPINLDKKLTFTSSRGHSFIFPSSNLSYMGVSASENFNQVGVNCTMSMNVVSYPNKEFVETNPSVKIYECSVKNGFDDSDQTLIYRKVGDKNFVIQIIDPAWVNFANNIEIQVNN